jgi:hypothetical protein
MAGKGMRLTATNPAAWLDASHFCARCMVIGSCSGFFAQLTPPGLARRRLP